MNEGDNTGSACPPNSEAKLATGIPVKLLQKNQTTEAGEYLYGQRRTGELSAAFLYSATSDGGDAWGNLYVFLPETKGFTFSGHEAIKGRFTIQRFRQREEVTLWIKDTEIDEAVNLVLSSIADVK